MKRTLLFLAGVAMASLTVDSVTAVVAVVADITDRKRAEDSLKEANQRKDEFLAMLSHELRNPLSAIFNALHILRLQGNENPIQQRAMTTMERQVGQLAHLVDDLLEVSRVITGRIQLQTERLDLRGVVEQAIGSVRPLIERRKHELSVSLPAEPVWVQGDPTRLEQVMVNLLNNAAKFTPKNGRIELVCHRAGDDAGDHREQRRITCGQRHRRKLRLVADFAQRDDGLVRLERAEFAHLVRENVPGSGWDRVDHRLMIASRSLTSCKVRGDRVVAGTQPSGKGGEEDGGSRDSGVRGDC